MGAAFAAALLKSGLVKSSELQILEVSAQRRAKLKRSLRTTVAPHADSEITHADVIILAVKPQDAASCCETLRPFTHAGQLLISIMAGVPIATLRRLLPEVRDVVRSMPSLPAKIKLGIAAYYAPSGVTRARALLASRILETTGTVIRLKRESLLDAATALSGSGPAYVFYFIEKLFAVARTLGFSPREAEMLLYHTLRGATELWRESGVSAKELRAEVTSKRGTTAAAFGMFEKYRVGEALQLGVKAAHQRGRELARIAARPAR